MLKITFYTALFLLLFQLAGKSYTGFADVVPSKVESVVNHTADVPADPGMIHLAYNLQVPDAIASPAVSFQFGFIEAFCLFILLWAGVGNLHEVCRIIPRFIWSYFEKLFSSLILINAP